MYVDDLLLACEGVSTENGYLCSVEICGNLQVCGSLSFGVTDDFGCAVIESNSFLLLKKISFTQISLYFTRELVHTVK